MVFDPIAYGRDERQFFFLFICYYIGWIYCLGVKGVALYNAKEEKKAGNKLAGSMKNKYKW